MEEIKIKDDGKQLILAYEKDGKVAILAFISIGLIFVITSFIKLGPNIISVLVSIPLFLLLIYSTLYQSYFLRIKIFSKVVVAISFSESQIEITTCNFLNKKKEIKLFNKNDIIIWQNKKTFYSYKQIKNVHSLIHKLDNKEYYLLEDYWDDLSIFFDKIST